VEIQLHTFFTSALDWGERSASRLGRFTPRESVAGTHWLGGWVGPRAGLDAVVKSKIPSLTNRWQEKYQTTWIWLDEETVVVGLFNDSCLNAQVMYRGMVVWLWIMTWMKSYGKKTWAVPMHYTSTWMEGNHENLHHCIRCPGPDSKPELLNTKHKYKRLDSGVRLVWRKREPFCNGNICLSVVLLLAAVIIHPLQTKYRLLTPSMMHWYSSGVRLAKTR
jgi:hypothetical protein